jgi:hypothetical protein
MPLPRNMLIQARRSPLPTLWSSCLAGWWLGGGRHLDRLIVVFLSVTALYLGGGFLRGALDNSSEGSHRGAWRWAVAFLAAGALLLLYDGPRACAFGLSLVLVIVLEQTIPRSITVSPLLQGLRRVWLYLLGASVAIRGISGWSIWCGLAAGLYTVGVGYLAQPKALPRETRHWPLALLVVPIGLALVMDVDGYRQAGLLLSTVVGLWTLRCLRQTFWALKPEPNRTQAGLAAGVCFVDWLATCPAAVTGPGSVAERELSVAFLIFFGLGLLQQKVFGKVLGHLKGRDAASGVV